MTAPVYEQSEEDKTNCGVTIMKQTKTYLSKTMEELKPSGIRRFFDLASGMEGVISLGVGEPDFVTLGMSEKRQFFVRTRLYFLYSKCRTT